MPHSLYLGIDIGSVAAKGVVIDTDGAIHHTIYRRTHGKSLATARTVLADLLDATGNRPVAGIGFTGAGGGTYRRDHRRELF